MHPKWSTENVKSNNLLSLKGMADFRSLFGMKPVTQLKGYKKVKSLSKMHNDYLKHYNEFGQEVYVGKYNAVYMDEVMRTDYSKASEELKSIQMKCRYGNFNQDGLARLKEITATESDLRTDPEWKNRTTLTGFHYFSSLHPERSNADSKNASALIDYSTASGNGIMKFEAIHSPPDRAEALSALSAKEFQ